ncbi:MAG: hypothetical protein ACOZBW_01025 [Thermodesulfobacteriota bacterium]
MIHANEIVMLALGVGSLAFILMYRSRLASVPARHLLLTAYGFFLAACLLTVFEGFFWTGVFNFLEHLCYACGTLALADWCRRMAFSKAQRDP